MTDGRIGSVVNISGALIAFGTSSLNTVSITNTLCSAGCSSLGGLPIALSGGASLSQLTITTPIKNQGTNSLAVSPTAAVISVDGTKSKVTISGNEAPPGLERGAGTRRGADLRRVAVSTDAAPTEPRLAWISTEA